MNKYEEIKEKHQKRVDDFPLGFAFNDKQFIEMMKKWGLSENDTDKIYSIGAGGFIRKTDIDEYNKMCNVIIKEQNDLIEQDKTGEGYIKDMFLYELENHEYNITCDLTDTLDALDFSYEDIINNPKLKYGLELAIKEICEKEKEDYDL